MKKKLNQIKNASTYILVTAAFLILQLLSAQGKLNSTTRGFLVPACAYIVLAVSLNLLVGICGELSLGHAGFMGIGAFTGIIVTSLLAGAVPNGVLRLVIGMIVGGVLAGLVGFVIGIPVLRLRGDYLAIVTLAFGEIIKDLINCLITFVSKCLMAAICAWIAFGGKEDGKGKHARLVVGSVIGALSYVALYMLKTYIFQRFVHGYPLDAVVVTMGSKLPASLINAVFAMIVAPILYAAIAPALRRRGLLEKLRK